MGEIAAVTAAVRMKFRRLTRIGVGEGLFIGIEGQLSQMRGAGRCVKSPAKAMLGWRSNQPGFTATGAARPFGVRAER